MSTQPPPTLVAPTPSPSRGHLLPPNATAPERALSLSVDRAVPVPIKTLWSPQTCPEGVLPWLAWALSVDDWDAAWTVERKRAAVAESIEVHRHKGTIGALRRALEQLGYEVEIDEKTGVAYTFRLLFKVGEGSAGGSLLEDAVTRATEIALRQKNARSELIGTLYLSENGATGGPIIAGANISGSETDVEDFAVNPNRFVAGELTPDATGLIVPAGMMEGRKAFSTDGNQTNENKPHTLVAWQAYSIDGYAWIATHTTEEGEIAQWVNIEDTPEPPQDGWFEYGSVGTLTLI